MAEVLELDPHELCDLAARLGLLTTNELSAKEVLRVLEGAKLDEVAVGQ